MPALTPAVVILFEVGSPKVVRPAKPRYPAPVKLTRPPNMPWQSIPQKDREALKRVGRDMLDNVRSQRLALLAAGRTMLAAA
jgi:hypothetical protein